ncbi:MAG: hypothetical protein ACJ72Z_10885 [Pyrinomonadaceae bacterium]
MSSPEAGNTVTCGICGKETKVQFITEREGGQAYDLECLHRNTVCPTCKVLVRDDSDSVQKVEPLCRTCNPEAFADDEDEVAAAV